MEAIWQPVEHNPMRNSYLSLLLFVAIFLGHFGRFNLYDRVMVQRECPFSGLSLSYFSLC